MIDETEVYRAVFLDMGGYHQMADLVNQDVAWPPGWSMETDGCLVGHPHLHLDGFEEIEPGLYIPTIAECRDRITAVHRKPGLRFEHFCMSPQCSQFQSVVKASTCETCELRRGRNMI